MNCRRVLMISPSFPPIADSESFCGAKMALALIDAGCEVEVLYSSNHRGGVRLDDSPIWKELSQYAHDVPVPSPSRNKLESVASAVRFKTLSFARWIRDMVQQAKVLHEEKPFQAVYSRSLPMIAHIAGYHVSRRLRLPWVANLNDPWDFHLFPDARPGSAGVLNCTISNYWLLRTMCTADLVTYCSTQLRDYHHEITGNRRQSAILPHIGRQAASDSLPGHAGTEGLHMVHAGKLGINEFTGRSTEVLLLGIAGFVQKHEKESDFHFSLTLVGPEDPATVALINELHLGKFVHCVGAVNYEQSLQWIRAASVCVLIEAKMQEGIFFPSKCADYIAAGKPILAFSPDKGVIADFGAQYGGFIRIHGDNVQRVVSVLEIYYAAHKRGQLHELAAAQALRSICSAGHVAEEFLRQLDTVTTNRSGEKETAKSVVNGRPFPRLAMDGIRKR